MWLLGATETVEWRGSAWMLLGLQTGGCYHKMLPCWGNSSWTLPPVCEESKEKAQTGRPIFVDNWWAEIYWICQLCSRSFVFPWGSHPAHLQGSLPCLGKMKKGAPVTQYAQRKYCTSAEVPINKWWIALGTSQSYQPCSSGRKILLQGTSVKAACTKCSGSIQKGGWGEISREWQWLRSWEVLQKGDKIWE